MSRRGLCCGPRVPAPRVPGPPPGPVRSPQALPPPSRVPPPSAPAFLAPPTPPTPRAVPSPQALSPPSPGPPPCALRVPGPAAPRPPAAPLCHLRRLPPRPRSPTSLPRSQCSGLRRVTGRPTGRAAGPPAPLPPLLLGARRWAGARAGPSGPGARSPAAAPQPAASSAARVYGRDLLPRVGRPAIGGTASPALWRRRPREATVSRPAFGLRCRRGQAPGRPRESAPML